MKLFGSSFIAPDAGNRLSGNGKKCRGVALALTLMMMVVVFSICTLITVVLLTRLTTAKVYKENLETERLYTQIGEIFFDVGGAYSLDFDSEFADALIAFGFEIENKPQDEQNENAEVQKHWIISASGKKFLLSFSAVEVPEEQTEKILEIKDSSGDKTLLTVGVQDNKLTKWKSD